MGDGSKGESEGDIFWTPEDPNAGTAYRVSDVRSKRHRLENTLRVEAVHVICS